MWVQDLGIFEESEVKGVEKVGVEGRGVVRGDEEKVAEDGISAYCVGL